MYEFQLLDSLLFLALKARLSLASWNSNLIWLNISKKATKSHLLLWDNGHCANEQYQYYPLWNNRTYNFFFFMSSFVTLFSWRIDKKRTFFLPEDLVFTDFTWLSVDFCKVNIHLYILTRDDFLFWRILQHYRDTLTIVDQCPYARCVFNVPLQVKCSLKEVWKKSWKKQLTLYIYIFIWFIYISAWSLL